MTSLTLAADVGGTNTRIALCHGHTVDQSTVRRYENEKFDSLEDVLKLYATEVPSKPDAVCVAVAGPVRDGVGQLTNRDWTISAEKLQEISGAPNAYVINDLEAQGHALDHVAGQLILGTPPPADHGTRLVIGVGTGFNAAPVHSSDDSYHVAASEAGHTTLPVWNEDSLALAQSIISEHGFASVEEALSGRGLLRIHAHMTDAEPHPDGMAITEKALNDPTSEEARSARLMAEILGRVAGDLALVHLPEGGVYLIGGMSRALGPWLQSQAFETGYLDKGRFSNFMHSFPVFWIEDDYAALIGCAGYVIRNL